MKVRRLTLHNGHKIQTASNRRYALVGDFENGASMIMRSDSVATLRTRARRERPRYRSGRVTFWIWDTLTGDATITTGR